jgi:hypothetical protein
MSSKSEITALILCYQFKKNKFLLQIQIIIINSAFLLSSSNIYIIFSVL